MQICHNIIVVSTDIKPCTKPQGLLVKTLHISPTKHLIDNSKGFEKSIRGAIDKPPSHCYTCHILPLQEIS
jgi:hypothetical protein